MDSYSKKTFMRIQFILEIYYKICYKITKIMIRTKRIYPLSPSIPAEVFFSAEKLHQSFCLFLLTVY